MSENIFIGTAPSDQYWYCTLRSILVLHPPINIRCVIFDPLCYGLQKFNNSDYVTVLEFYESCWPPDSILPPPPLLYTVLPPLYRPSYLILPILNTVLPIPPSYPILPPLSRPSYPVLHSILPPLYRPSYPVLHIPSSLLNTVLPILSWFAL